MSLPSSAPFERRSRAAAYTASVVMRARRISATGRNRLVLLGEGGRQKLHRAFGYLQVSGKLPGSRDVVIRGT
jgi:hypothetical protein